MLAILKCSRLIRRSGGLAGRTVAFFSKQAHKKEAGGKKDEPAAAPVVVEKSTQQIVSKWLQPNHPSLSPAELKYFNENFDDLSAEDKKILDDFAQTILDLPTAVLFEVIKKGALGTTQMYYTSVEHMTESEIPKALKQLRKQI